MTFAFPPRASPAPSAPAAHRAPRSTVTWSRACALLLVVFVATGQLAASAHLSRARHDECAEHGEWVERAGHAHPEDTLADGATTPTRPRHALRSEPVSASDHGHHHCDSLSIRRARAAEPGAALEAPLPIASSASRPAPRDALFPRPVPLLHLAPKNSPPA